MYDVVVVGGGPVGSYVAYKLAEVGYGVAVLEQKKRVGEPVCCAGIIGQECVRAFNIDNKVILRRANSARLFFPSGRCLRIWRKEFAKVKPIFGWICICPMPGWFLYPKLGEIRYTVNDFQVINVLQKFFQNAQNVLLGF